MCKPWYIIAVVTITNSFWIDGQELAEHCLFRLTWRVSARLTFKWWYSTSHSASKGKLLHHVQLWGCITNSVSHGRISETVLVCTTANQHSFCTSITSHVNISVSWWPSFLQQLYVAKDSPPKDWAISLSLCFLGVCVHLYFLDGCCMILWKQVLFFYWHAAWLIQRPVLTLKPLATEIAQLFCAQQTAATDFDDGKYCIIIWKSILHSPSMLT